MITYINIRPKIKWCWNFESIIQMITENIIMLL